MHYNTYNSFSHSLLLLTTLFSQVHTETIIALQSNGTPILKALQEKQISRPLIQLILTK